MKKWLVLLIAIPLLSIGSFGGEDVGKLAPVQGVMLTQENGLLHIKTDSGQAGIGVNGTAAVEDMMQTASTRVFLDTAEYLMLEPKTEIWLPQLKEYLRPSCKVCYVIGTVDLREAVKYLQLHQQNVNLAQYEAGNTTLHTLIYNEGRMTLVRS